MGRLNCAECDKDSKSLKNGLCRTCFANAYCGRCEVYPRALKELCVECHAAWQRIVDRLYAEFVGRIRGPKTPAP